MALPPDDPAMNKKIDQSMGEPMAAKVDGTSAGAIYKLMGDTKVPVSKYEGPMWRARRDMGQKAIERNAIAWNEAESYYNNSQMNHRKATEGDSSGNDNIGKNKGKRFSHTENIVYSTVNAVIPATYAKNPTIEVTMYDAAQEELGVIAEHLGNRLASMKHSPGINLKPKITKSILRCEITNEAWIMVGYTLKEFSADQAREDIKKLGDALIAAKSEDDIREIEGKLMALEESVDLLDPSGPFVRSLRSNQVLVDPNANEDDFCDANWMQVFVFIPTAYLNAKYRTKNDKGEWVSPYEGTHVADASVADANVDAMQREIDSFKLLKSDTSYENYGYKDKQSFDRAKVTKVWYCFDKVKRRFYMYADNDWKWPIWVYDDPYHLPGFYPLHRMQFHTDPAAIRTKGEVSHYLDQQDTINTINDEMHRARVNVRSKVLYDSDLYTMQQIVDFLNDGNQMALGVKVPEGKDLTKTIFPPPLPAFQYKELWDKAPYYEAANKISGVGAVLQGAQFKTNTTNQAIETYSSVSNQRIDAKIDAVEDFVGSIMYDVLFLCMQFMDEETVFSIIGQKDAQELGQWQPMQPQQIRNTFMCTVEGGSTQKPTSAAKKQEALAIGQTLGQFASATPAVVLTLMKVYERAFDGIVMTDEDWEALEQAVQMAMQAQMNPGAGGGGEPSPDGGGDMQQMVAKAVQRGVPQEVAQREITARMGQTKQ